MKFPDGQIEYSRDEKLYAWITIALIFLYAWIR